jgi:Icc-related predicted phosphoesterase
VDHKDSVRYIFGALKEQMDAGRKTVVVTHHGPSYLSVAAQFKGDRYNGAYVTELGNEIVDAGGPNVWVHGHTHVSLDYMIGDVTRVVVNPRGYVGHELNDEFDPKMLVEVK